MLSLQRLISIITMGIGKGIILNGSALSQAYTDLLSTKFTGVTGGYATCGNVLAFEYNQPFFLFGWIKPLGVHPTVDLGKCEILGKVAESTRPDNQFPHVGYHARFTQDQTGYNQRLCFYLVSSFDPTHGNHYMGITTPDHYIPLNQWTHFVVANFDGTAGNAKMWINGSPITPVIESDNLNGTITTTAAFAFASRNTLEDFFQGQINDCGVGSGVPSNTDVTKLYNGGVAIDPTTLTFSAGVSLLACWRMGDEDVYPTLKDRVGSNDGTVHTGNVFINDTEGSTFTPTPGWDPSQTAEIDGTTSYWMDGDDPASITQSGGAVSQWVDKSTNAYAYTASSHKPTVGTVVTTSGTRGIVQSDGTQWLAMASPANLMSTTDWFVMGFAVSLQAFAGAPPQYPGILGDGDGVRQKLKIGFSNDNVNSPYYYDFEFGQSSGGFNRFRWVFGLSAPEKVISTVQYNAPLNALASFIGYFNGTQQTTVAAGGFSSDTGAGQLFTIGSGGANVTMNGWIGEIVIIKNPSLKDVTNLKYYLSSRWS